MPWLFTHHRAGDDAVQAGRELVEEAVALGLAHALHEDLLGDVATMRPRVSRSTGFSSSKARISPLSAVDRDRELAFSVETLLRRLLEGTLDVIDDHFFGDSALFGEDFDTLRKLAPFIIAKLSQDEKSVGHKPTLPVVRKVESGGRLASPAGGQPQGRLLGAPAPSRPGAMDRIAPAGEGAGAPGSTHLADLIVGQHAAAMPPPTRPGWRSGSPPARPRRRRPVPSGPPGHPHAGSVRGATAPASLARARARATVVARVPSGPARPLATASSPVNTRPSANVSTFRRCKLPAGRHQARNRRSTSAITGPEGGFLLRAPAAEMEDVGQRRRTLDGRLRPNSRPCHRGREPRRRRLSKR